jgi:REP element-mobilizing transposase RayT
MQSGAMTAPRQVLPGTTYLVTRRCSQRQFLLRPSKVTNQTIGYLLAIAARRFHVDVHAFCVMSNHLHLVVTDPEASLPAFSQFFDSLVARSMNSLLARWEHFWAPTSYSAVALPGPAEVVDKSAYVLANPVAAGLVRRGRMWPGLWSAPQQLGTGQLEFKRPTQFFREKGATALPERASLTLVVPPGFASPDQFQRAVRDALEAREQSAAVDLAAQGRGFLGLQRVLAQPPFARPPRPEPRRGLNPRVACRDKWRRIQALGQLLDFLHDYRSALQKWRAGAALVVFPPGTYLMRVLHRAPCLPSG